MPSGSEFAITAGSTSEEVTACIVWLTLTGTRACLDNPITQMREFYNLGAATPVSKRSVLAVFGTPDKPNAENEGFGGSEDYWLSQPNPYLNVDPF